MKGNPSFPYWVCSTQNSSMAAQAFLFFFLLPTHLLLYLPSSQAEKQDKPYCSFVCGYLGQFGFPFSNGTDSKCGMLAVHGCNEAVQQVQIGNRLYEVKGAPAFSFYSMASVIPVYDKVLDSQLQSSRCQNLDNLPFPRSSFLHFEVVSNITLFKCNQTIEVTRPPDFRSVNCNDTNTIYYTSSQNVSQSILPECSMIQLPSKEKAPDTYLFSALASAFSLQVKVSFECYECYLKGGECRTNPQGNFYCKNGTDTTCYQCSRKGQPPCLTNTQGNLYCQNRKEKEKENKDGLKLELGLSLGLGVSVMVTALLIVVFFVHRRQLKKRFASSNVFSSHISRSPSSETDMESQCIYYGVPVFSYRELEEATHNFDQSRELGDGGFGTVYYGQLQDGREVAVKRLYKHNYKRVKQFINEIEILTRLRHKNLVSLYGCTSRHSRELLLVYEFIPNGTVTDHIHGDRAGLGSLSWPVRMGIAVETASALVYMHSSDIIHRDVKTSNILLDNNFCVKVADFGLSRLFPDDVTHASTVPQGTPGYVDPEYHQCYQLTKKSDVYSFGVVLVELISSMPAVDISRHRLEINLANLAVIKIQNQALDQLVDKSLGFDSDASIRKMINMVAELAFQCLQQDKELRPSMDEVLQTLIEIQSVTKHQAENEAPQPAHSPECDEVELLKK